MTEGFGKVYYNHRTRPGRPSFNEISVGKGYDGIEVTNRVWDIIPKVDVIAFPDIGDGDLQHYLRGQGHAVWGSGYGDELEMFRYYSKKVLESVGLPVNPYKLVVGVTALREELKKHDDRFVKVSFLRGLWESRHHETYWISKQHLDRLEYKLGPLAETTEFIVENPIKTKLEVGFDGMFVNGGFLPVAINGVEVKDECYLGVVQEYADMAEEFRTVNEALTPVLANYGYANFFSTELRVKRDPFLIDPCCRQGSPSGEAQLAIWKNLPQIVFEGAHGRAITPEHESQFVAQAMLYNRGDENEWCAVGIPKEHRDKVSLYFGMRDGDHDWVVPQSDPFDEIGSIVCTGDDEDAVIEECREIGKLLKGDISVKIDAFGEAQKQFDIMRKQGISVEPIPA